MLTPACCMFTKSSEGPFIDLGGDFDYDHAGRMYIKASYARELGTFAGLPSQDAVDVLTEERDELKARVAVLEQELEELREFEQAATYTVKHMGGKVRRPPGPKKQTAASAA